MGSLQHLLHLSVLSFRESFTVAVGVYCFLLLDKFLLKTNLIPISSNKVYDKTIRPVKLDLFDYVFFKLRLLVFWSMFENSYWSKLVTARGFHGGFEPIGEAAKMHRIDALTGVPSSYSRKPSDILVLII